MFALAVAHATQATHNNLVEILIVAGLIAFIAIGMSSKKK